MEMRAGILIMASFHHYLSKTANTQPFVAHECLVATLISSVFFHNAVYYL